MAEYRVRSGMAFGASNQYGPGDKVFLSPEEAAGFLDKLEAVEPGGEDASPWGDLAANVVKALEAAGLAPDAVLAMDDDALLAVKGIGPATLGAIRAALGQVSRIYA